MNVTSMCEGQKSAYCVLPQELSTLFFKTGLLTWDSQIRLHLWPAGLSSLLVSASCFPLPPPLQLGLQALMYIVLPEDGSRHAEIQTLENLKPVHLFPVLVTA